jgi:hypothetical protein
MPGNEYSLFYVLNEPKNLPKHKGFKLEEHSGLAEMIDMRNRSVRGRSMSTGRSPSEQQSSRSPSTGNSETVEVDCPKEVGASSPEAEAMNSLRGVQQRTSSEGRGRAMRGVSLLPFTPDFANKFVGRREGPHTGTGTRTTNQTEEAHAWLLPRARNHNGTAFKEAKEQPH